MLYLDTAMEFWPQPKRSKPKFAIRSHFDGMFPIMMQKHPSFGWNIYR